MSALNRAEMISLREFARRDGCDEKRVRTGVKNGQLPRFPDHKLPASLVGSGWREGNRRGKPATAYTMRIGRGLSAYPQGLMPSPAELRALLPAAATTLSAIAEGTCGDAAILMLPRVPFDIVEPLVTELMVLARRSAIALLEEDEVEPPDGYAAWADHPLFADPWPTPQEWETFRDEAQRAPLEGGCAHKW